jgi:hypothetical protein
VAGALLLGALIPAMRAATLAERPDDEPDPSSGLPQQSPAQS